MTEDRRNRVADLYHVAMERPPGERAGFLANACADDSEVRHEVESLLAHEGDADGLLENPGWRQSSSVQTNTLAPATLVIGQAIAEFRISGKLGSGGMGEVYRATDTKLHREVALKVLPAGFADNSAWMARFQREARVLASLNHPHIAAIYGLEESGSLRAIAMELVEGPTLAERLARGKIPIQESLGIARQIAEALEYAHEKGIIHRDLKPANVKLRPDGVVKVLDFGLAKAVDVDDRPTMSATGVGTILGTPAYMAPEQAAGLVVDRRADIWAFGVVLFEMLSGRQVYARKTTLETLAAVARDDPKWEDLPVAIPARVIALLRRCLDRNAKSRLRDIGEARVAIEAVLAGETVPLEHVPARPLWLAWSVAALATVGMMAVALLYFHQEPTPAAPIRFQIPTPENVTGIAQISPDGHKLAYRSGARLMLHSLESGESRDLTETEHSPFWSPDSRFIAYSSKGKLRKIEAAGGPSQVIADVSGVWGGAAWSKDDVIVFGTVQVGLFRVPASGGVPVQITALDHARHERAHFSPSFLPDGRHFVYVRASAEEGRSAIYVGSTYAKPDQQNSPPLVASDWPPGYAPSADTATGYLLFMRDGTMMAQPFDNRRLELKGQAAPIPGQVEDNGGGRGALVNFSASANDVLVFQRRRASRLAWYDREGKVLGDVGEPGHYDEVALSPDGTRAAVQEVDGTVTGSIWLLDLRQGGATTRITSGSFENGSPVWSPDGTRIVFSSNRDGPFNLYHKSANGGRDEEALLKSGEDKYATSWSRDGRFLLYSASLPKTKSDIWVLPLESDSKPVPFLNAKFNEDEAHFSPDGHWVAYTSDESGQDEVYVRSFSMNAAGTAVEVGGKWPISNGYGGSPSWRGDGRELYYRSRAGGVMAVEIATSAVFRAGSPQPLGAPFRLWNSFGTVLWDSAPDGKRFLGLAANNGSQPYTVVLNWQAGLKK